MRRSTIAMACATILVMVFSTVMAFAEAQGNNFGGPGAVENQIAADNAAKNATIDKRLVQSWFDWKSALQEDHGIAVGMDYSTVFLSASETGLSGEDAASSGMFRFYGSWDLNGRGSANTGGLVWKLEGRHKYGNIPPSALEFELGGVGLITPPFSDQGGRVTNLYWRQRLNEGRITLVGGFLDATDYFDVFILASPWTGFMNFAFSTGTTTAFLPNDATLGFAAGSMLSDKVYFIGGLTNAYANPEVPFRGFEQFGDGEYFTSLELGLTLSQGNIYHDNAHVTYWHVDESSLAGTPGGWGLNFQYVRHLGEKWLPFLRAGYADEGGSLMQRSVSAGFGYKPAGSPHQLGVAANWGQVNESSFGTGLKDQYTYEVFYLLQLSEQFAVTPSAQLLKDAPNNPDHDSIWLWGVRARLAL